MYKIGVIGTGSWGTTISYLVSENIKNKQNFNKEVLLYGVKEYYDNILLSDIINQTHINKKYLPDILLNKNIRCTSSVSDFHGVDILIVALPHQFIQTVCQFKEIITEKTIILSVVKGLIENNGISKNKMCDNSNKMCDISNNNMCDNQSSNDSFELISDYLKKTLNLPVNVLMGANIALDVAKGIQGNILYKSESTLGYENESDKEILFSILNNKMYKINCIKNIKGVELCGSLKNIISLGYGLMEGLNCSGNTKVAFLRNGLVEMKKFFDTFYPDMNNDFLFESCGVADLVVSCLSGRNYKYGKAKACGKTLDEFEKEIGNQKIQGVGTLKCFWGFLKHKKALDKFLVFDKIYQIFCGEGENIEILNTF